MQRDVFLIGARWWPGTAKTATDCLIGIGYRDNDHRFPEALYHAAGQQQSQRAQQRVNDQIRAVQIDSLLSFINASTLFEKFHGLFR